ncbi:LIP-domain-containing protein [Aspergillus candidus]|uniref:LIP-domain-containing protein n=1 Tax=Aspergillus candidus TaxID=41067 RepID=A0A2I2EZB5_ASPCN|nr:LIP-domain-containing protein [Aspergillus candidus]PLB33712.1 LIP-domain-containing protein [Aspergillus candidus]
MRIRLSLRLALLGLCLAPVISAHPTGSATPQDVPRGLLPQDPSEDPFYQPPGGFEAEPPGTVLRSRRIVASFFGLLPNLIEAHQLLYRTTAIDGSAISTVTTVFKPHNAKPDRFISFHTAYDSSAVSCQPSYQYQLGSPQTDLILSLEMIVIQIYLLLGYVVASPDYEGPDAAFGPGRLEGTGVLDGIRAVGHHHAALGLDSATPPVVGVGYSGGAIATGWAAGLQPAYAPELDIRGWVAGGTPANLTGTLVFIDGTAFSGFIPAAIVGLNQPSAYGARLQPVLDEIVTDAGRSILDTASTQCAPAALVSFFGRSLFDPEIQTMGPEILHEPTVSDILKANTMGANSSETPTAPVFLYHATDDEIIPYSNATTLRDAWCTDGADVHFTTFASGGHATTEVIGLPRVLKFVEAAFEGKTAKGCAMDEELSDKLEPLALGVSLEPVLVKLLHALMLAGTKDAKLRQDVKVWGETF